MKRSTQNENLILFQLKCEHCNTLNGLVNSKPIHKYLNFSPHNRIFFPEDIFYSNQLIISFLPRNFIIFALNSRGGDTYLLVHPFRNVPTLVNLSHNHRIKSSSLDLFLQNPTSISCVYCSPCSKFLLLQLSTKKEINLSTNP